MKHFITVALLLSSVLCSAQMWVDTLYSIQSQFDISYGNAVTFAGYEETLSLDLSYPVDDVPPVCGRPLAVIVHGGAWFAGDKNEGYPTLLRQDFAKSGYVAVSVDYRLGMFNTNQFVNCNVPDWNCFNMTDSSEFYRANYRAIQDVNGAIRYLINHANDYQIDPNNVFLVGESAGGFVAMGVGFIDDESEILEELVGNYPDAPPPNSLYENGCIQTYDLANSISDMDLERPELGSIEGELNLPVESEYTIQAVGNLYGGAFNNIFENFSTASPKLYLYHQPCDLIVPFQYNKLLQGYNNCLSQFPTSCGTIVNRPYAFGSKGIKDLIDDLAANDIATTEYYFDNSGNTFSCLQQIDPSLSCHALDNYGLRTTNMASYFAESILPCNGNDVPSFVNEDNSLIKKVYPNPTERAVFIEFHQRVDDVTLQFVNVFGEVVSKCQVYNLSSTRLATDHLSPGIYHLIASNDYQLEQVTLIIVSK